MLTEIEEVKIGGWVYNEQCPIDVEFVARVRREESLRKNNLDDFTAVDELFSFSNYARKLLLC